MAGAFALPLQEYFASLDETSLPKILQVCSGVYFQGSVYELSGSEVCFSTGDLIKVIGLELHSVSCQDVLNNENFELPITHTGLFRVVPDEMPFSSVKEMMSLRPVSLDSCLPFTFTSRSKMTVGDLTLGAGRMLTVLSIEQQEGQEDQVRCHLKGSQETSAEVCIPMSFRGEFYECESEESFSLQEIMSSSTLRSRRFRFSNTAKCQRPLIFSPIYQIHAIMSMRKNALKFPSSLEIDVVDITNTSQDIEFVTPLSLTEVMSQPDEMFPTVVAILDPPVNHFMFKSTWTAKLNKETRLLLHKKTTKSFMLLSTPKSRKTQQYFLVCPQYKGRFRKRPREFNSAYELYVASTQTGSLNVSVTKNCEEDVAEGLPALSVGEKLEIVCCTRMELSSENSKEETQSVEALLCQRLQEQDDEDDSDSDEEGVEKDDKKDEVFLPLYMQGHFVEVLSDNKKYKLSDLGENCSLPLDMKVVSRDTELETDPLSGFSCLRLEAIISEPVIQASFLHKPEHCFDIPIQWLSMNVIFTKDSLPEGQPPKCYVEKVTEVNDYFFYEFRKQACSNEAPPPRPPKRSLPTEKSSKKASKSKKKTGKTNKTKHRKESAIPIEEMSNLTLTNKRRPPAPPPPEDITDEPPPIVPRKHPEDKVAASRAVQNTYVKVNQSEKTQDTDENSDHDYETLDENLVAMMKTAQESVVFY
ncbi:protein THEMIS2 [Oryzias melastigma]|uniref:protein THEMIS2 n=1 Tax=Oryzias melastigma TaxID=30732 RepID=UPI000CF7ED44|nr:protein THEMIS2 [Oryzias melastigma]XP_024123358.1 protein THEMIS2 [Oryzias melastigma]